MKKHIITLVLVIFSISLFAQNVKYDDIIDIVKQGDTQKAYSLLFDYQQKNPDFANTYFQLGNITYSWAINSDPLTDLAQTEYYIYHTKLFYGLAKSNLLKQDHDARKNDDFYKTIPELSSIDKLDNPIVIDFIDKRIEKIEEYDKNMHKSVDLFQHLVKSYDKTIFAFFQIINQYNNLNNIYLQPKSTTLKFTNNLILLYDSTLNYYQLYKNSITNYPLKDYNQFLIETPINTYRLQGVISTNFLNDSIQIWDFKSWAKQIQTKLNTDISHFRETISKTNKELVDKDTKLSRATNFSNSFQKYILDQKAIFEIEKYDYNSIITSLFQYRKAKIDFLVQLRRFYNDTSNYSIKPSARAIEYYHLTQNKIIIDSLLIQLKTKINQENYLKHKDFFDYNYQGFTGLRSFVSKQELDNETRYKNAIENFKYFTYRDIFMQISKPSFADYKNSKVPLFAKLENPLTATVDYYHTLDVANYNNSKYITGYYKTSYGTTPYIAKITNGQIEWFKSTSSGPRMIEYGYKIQASKEGCFVIIHSTHNNISKNILIQLSPEGRQISKKMLDNKNLPRYLNYDDINSEILVAFNGSKFNYFTETSDTLVIEKISTIDNSIIFTKTLTFQGQIINILKINSTYHLIANYGKFANGSDNYINPKGNIIHISFNETGEITHIKELMSAHYLYGNYAYKINNETINIVGIISKANIKTISFNNLPSISYLIIKPNDKIIFQNFE